ncbi:VC0807 family protein [Streptomyces sp. NPDC046261]|uniref:VC0807 family protein n=1 Tax=Streptomyces sp. NPDC046261 TaxID=3157200 RepID=UPI0033D3680A
MSSPSPAPSVRRTTKTTALSWSVSIVCNIVLPIVTYDRLTGAGWSEFSALVLSGVWPLVDTVVYLVWHRRVDEFAVITLLFMLLTLAVTAVGPHSTRLLLVKDSAVTGLFGLLCLATLAAPRPLMFYFGRKFGTDGTKEGLARWNALWERQAGFRRVMRGITLVWGLGYTAEALARIGLSSVLPTHTMVVVNPVLAYGTPALLIAWTVACSKRARARSQAAEAAEAAAGPAAAAG